MKFIRKYLIDLIEGAFKENSQNILDLLERNSEAKLLDLGCDDGVWTMKLAKKIGTKDVHGVEIVDERMKIAEKKGVKVTKADLNQTLPLDSDYFDVVHSNQVIEHLSNTDTFLEEIYRVLKPGGYAIISTENLSSWHNIFALTLGFQPFSMTNFSNKGNIGNPFALWKGKESKNSALTAWQHMRLFSYFGLKDLLKAHGFSVKKIITAGYYPVWGGLAKIDKIHGHWIAIKVEKRK